MFAVLVFISKTFIPSPVDKVLIVVQALFLGLGTLMLAPLGGTIVSTTAGVLTSAWRPSFAPFTLGFAVLYGLLVDTFSILLSVKAENGSVRTRRLVAAVTLATAVTGMASYYTTVYVISLLPRNIVLEAAILAIGIVNGVVGGYLAAMVWAKALKHFVS